MALSRQDRDPARRGREPETGLRQEKLAREAAEAQNREAEERRRRAEEAGREKDDAELGIVEDKEHGYAPTADSDVAEAVQAGVDVDEREARRAVGTPVISADDEDDGQPRRGRRRKGDD